MVYRFKKEYRCLLVALWILLFTFQNLLIKISPIFSYIDEAPILFYIFFSLMRVFSTKKIYLGSKENKKCFLAISIFLISGLIGNVLYKYQPVNLVIIDLLTNLKFYGAIAFFSMWISKGTLGNKYIPRTAKYSSIILATFFLIDRIMNIFPAEYRYGIKSTVLFYGHPTYLAGISAFLIAILTIYSPQKYKKYIFLDLVIMIFTLRSKAIVCALVYIMMYFAIKKLHYKIKTWHILIFTIIGIGCAWSQIYYYFIYLNGQAARSIMFLTSLHIMKDYFPFGTGFATFASHSASAQVNYSPVYIKYGFDTIWELRNSTIGTFFDDQFWPIIFGQTGIIGTICYVFVLIFLFKKIQKLYKKSLNIYCGCLFVFIYLMVSSIAEPAFNNSVAIPFALVLAIGFLGLKKC